MKEYIALFFTQSGAIKFERYLRKEGYWCELRPVPRKLSSNCGIGAQFKCDCSISIFISEDIEQIYEMAGDKYTLVYNGE